MIIQKMNNVLVKHSKVLFGIFTAIIIVSFVWFFTPGVSGSLFFGRKTDMNAACGSVLDQPVTYQDMQDAGKVLVLFQAALMGKAAQLPESQIFQQAAVYKAACILGCQAGEADAVELMKKLPAFQENNAFSTAKYNEFCDKVLAPMGYTKKDLDDALLVMASIGKLEKRMSFSVPASGSEMTALVKQQLSEFSVRPVIFHEKDFASKLKVEEKEAKDFFEANKADFMTEPKYDGLLAFRPYAKATDKDVKEFYEKNKADFQKDGKTLTLKEAKPWVESELQYKESANAMQQFKEFNKEIRKLSASQIAPKAAFENAAKKFGLKLIPFQNITKSTKANPAMIAEDVVISELTKLNQINSKTLPIPGEKGVYEVLITARAEAKEAPFEEMKAKVIDALKSKKARALMAEKEKALRQKLKASKTPAKDLEKLVKEFGGTLKAAETNSPLRVTMTIQMMRQQGLPAPRELMIWEYVFDAQVGELAKSVMMAAPAAANAPATAQSVALFLDKVTLPQEKQVSEFLANKGMTEMLQGQKHQLSLLEFSDWMLNRNLKYFLKKGEMPQ